MGTMQVWEGLKLCTHKQGRNIKFSVSLCLYASLSLMHSHVNTYTHILSHPLPLLPFFPASVSHPPPGPSLLISPSLSLSFCFHLSSPSCLLSFSHFLSLSLSLLFKRKNKFFDLQVLFLTF